MAAPCWMTAKGWKMRKSYIVIGVTVVVLGGVIGFAKFRETMIAEFLANMPEPTISVSAAAVGTETWTRSIPAIGTLEAVNGVMIASSQPGLVKAILVQSGATVKAGDRIVELDYDVELADLKSAEAKVRLGSLTVNRLRSLRISEATSQATLDEAEANLNMAAAQADSIRATIAKKVISAPFDGVLGIVRIDKGQYLQPGEAIVNVQDLSELLLTATLEQSALPSLQVGQTVKAHLTPYPEEEFSGTLSAIEPQVDTNGLVKIQARFPNPQGKLRPGMFAKLDIEMASRDTVMTVPQTAVSYSLYGDSVYVIAKDDKGEMRVERRQVTLGHRQNGVVEVRSGLKTGDQVVTTGAMKLNNRSKVTVVEGATLNATPKIGVQ